jgi:hypothetical protein
MLEKSAKEGINKEIIAKTAKAFAKGSQKPLDVVGNYLAQKFPIRHLSLEKIRRCRAYR